MSIARKGFALGWVVSGDGNTPLFGKSDVQVLTDAGAQIVRFDLRLGSHPAWDETILGHYRGVVSQLQAANIGVIGLLGDGIVPRAVQRDWNANAAEQGSRLVDNAFLTAYATNACAIARALPTIDLWELWNEPNQWDHAPDAHGGPDQPGGSYIFPSLYARLLRRTYPAVKAVQPESLVITGGLLAHDGDLRGSSGYDYFTSVLRYLQQPPLQGDPRPYDAIGLHLYLDQGRAAQPAHLDACINLIGGLTGGRPIYVTEAGWRTDSGAFPAEQAWSIAQGAVTPRQQAANLAALYDTCRASSRNLAAVCWFTLYDNPNARDDQNTYGVMAYAGAPSQGMPKPALAAMRAVARVGYQPGDGQRDGRWPLVARSTGKERTMPQGLSLHIGLNAVDASKYNGWPGTLAGCVNDANAMQAIASAQGFVPTMLITEAATADAILTEIGKAAHALQTGDTFLLSYSGHGGQVPDPTGDSSNGLDDTWAAYDRQLLGHELYNLWSQFAAGVRIEVYSDSCHSGTVIRDIILAQGKDLPRSLLSTGADRGTRAFNTVYGAAPHALDRGIPAMAAYDALKQNSRAIPAELALQLYDQNKTMYRALQWSRNRADILASVILISGCQDNQESQDGQNNGLFTEKLLAVWNNGQFQGTLPQFQQAIVALMPSTQTPNYFTVGADDPTFTNSRPLTIVDASTGGDASTTGGDASTTGGDASTTGGDTTASTNTAANTSTPPSVTVAGSASLDRDTDGPPSFTVNLGSNPYYVFEITSDTALFGNAANRSASNFYGSWNDPTAQARMTDPAYTLPQAAWDALKGNDTLYYRVGSTTSQSSTAYANYLVSVTDAAAASQAPSLSITGGKAAPIAGDLGEYAIS